MDQQLPIVILLSVAVLVCLYMAGTVLIKSPKNYQSRAFAVFVTLMSLWTVVSFFENTTSQAVSTLLVKIDFALGPLLGLAFLVFATSFSHTRINDLLFKILILASSLLSLTAFTPLLIAKIVFTNGPDVSSGILYVPYSLFIVALLLGGIGYLVNLSRKATGLYKLRVRLILLALSTSAAIVVVTNLVLPRLSSNTTVVNLIPKIGSLLSLVWFATVSFYTILRHRFLDVRLAIRSVLAKLLVAFIWTNVLWLAVLVYDFFYPDPTLNHQLIITIAFTVSFILVTSYETVYSLLARLTNRFLFQDDYNAAELVRTLSRQMSQSISLPLLRETIESTIKTALQPSFVKLSLQNEDGSVPVIIKKLMETKHALVLDELRAEDDAANVEIIKALENIKAAVVLYLSSKDNLLGILILGEKLNNDAYSSTDLATLETISYQASVVLENAYLYQASLDFNATLKDEVKKATADLQTAYDRLKELDRAKDEFVSVVSHELRTPMTIIKNYLWMLATSKGGELSSLKHEYVEKANQGVERMLNLVNDMLDVSRIDQGRVALNIGDVDLGALLKDVVGEFEIKAKEKGLELNYESVGAIHESPAIVVRADEEKVREIVTNLLGNACKFTEKGGITITVSDSGIRTPESVIRISVTDTGKGISSEDLPKLFHKFSRVGGSAYTTVAEAGGTGLGLYISKSLVEKMGGQIGVTSQVGHGSTFWFTIPASGIGSEAKPSVPLPISEKRITNSA